MNISTNYIAEGVMVVIPAFNCKNYISDAVSSIKKQPYKKIIIILVDDGSTDGSSEICDNIAKKWDGIFVIHQKNAGVSAARNVGIEFALSACEGHECDCYISFLDADDAWMCNFFDVDVNHLMAGKYDLIGFQSCECNQQFTKRNAPEHLKEGEYKGGVSAIWIHATQHFCAMLYSCEMIKKCNLRFQVGLEYTEDKVFSMSALYLADKIILKNKLMLLHRQNYTSAMHMRSFGISYFAPIIHAYMMLDRNMAPFQNAGRKELIEGRKLASIYVMDMADEHFSRFGSMREFQRFFSENEDRDDLIPLLNGENPLIPANDAFLKMRCHPVKYVVVKYLKGIIYIPKRLLAKFSFIRKMRDNRRFPIVMSEK